MCMARKTFFLVFAVSCLCSCQQIEEAEEIENIAKRELTSTDLNEFILNAEIKIQKKWIKSGGATGLGQAVSAVEIAADLCAYQIYENGVIVYSDDFGAVVLSENIFDRWIGLKNETGFNNENMFDYYGFPATDVASNADSEKGTFEKGIIVYSGGTTRLVYGGIYERYLELSDVVGLPVSEEFKEAAYHSYQAFEHGEIHKNRLNNKAVGTWGATEARWKELGGVIGEMGFPATEPYDIRTEEGVVVGEAESFEKGTIFSNGVHVNEVRGKILDEYVNKYGGPTGWLGFPISGEEIADSGDPYSNFEGGVLVKHMANDAWRGVNAFSELEFYLTRLQGYENDGAGGALGGQDVYAYIDISTSDGYSAKARDPESGNCDDSCSRNFHVPFNTTVHGAFEVNVSVEIRDADFWLIGGHNDVIGVVTETYNINNLWGRLVDHFHRDRKGSATMTIDGSIPYDPDDFMAQRWWSFENGSISELDYNQFAATFSDVGTNDNWLFNPINKLFYQTYKDIADGYCFGMVLESIYSDFNQSAYYQPIHRNFANTQYGQELDPNDKNHQSLIYELGIKHGYQLGASTIDWAISMFNNDMTHNPRANYEEIRYFLAKGTPLLLHIFDGYLFQGGHTVRPYGVIEPSDGDTHVKIQVADPNYPSGDLASISNITNTQIEEMTIDIDLEDNTFSYLEYDQNDGHSYVEYHGGSWSGGRMFFQRSEMLMREQFTPIYLPLQMLSNVFIFSVGRDAKTSQITDESGRTFFQPGLTEIPTRWDQIQQDDNFKIPNMAPIVTTGHRDEPMPVQMFAGYNAGTTQHYDIIPAAETPDGTPYEVAVQSSKLSSHFQIPSQSGVTERITAKNIDMSDKAISLQLAENAVAKEVTWTIGGPEKQRWAQLSGMLMTPGQEITISLTNGGYDLQIENNGPATGANLKVKAGPDASEVEVGPIAIASGTTQTQFQLPVTSIDFDGEQFGNDGWLLAPVTVILTAKDYSSTGIQAIEYSKETATWVTYADPFIYLDEGETTLYFRARDNELNEESPKSHSLKIDTRVPVLNVVTDQTSYHRVQPFTVHYNAEDPMPGSGLRRLNGLLDGTGVSDGENVDLLWFSLGSHELAVSAEDIAGWTTNSTAPFELVATLESLPLLIQELRRRDIIDNDGIMNSFLAKADGAIDAANKNNADVAINVLEALINAVTAQSGNHISSAGADLLAADTQYVINHHQ